MQLRLLCQISIIPHLFIFTLNEKGYEYVFSLKKPYQVLRYSAPSKCFEGLKLIRWYMSETQPTGSENHPRIHGCIYPLAILVGQVSDRCRWLYFLHYSLSVLRPLTYRFINSNLIYKESNIKYTLTLVDHFYQIQCRSLPQSPTVLFQGHSCKSAHFRP